MGPVACHKRQCGASSPGSAATLLPVATDAGMLGWMNEHPTNGSLLDQNARLLESWLRYLELRLEEDGLPGSGGQAARPKEQAPGDGDEELPRPSRAARDRIGETEVVLQARGIEVPLQVLVQRFGLGPQEIFVLMLAMAPALDAGFRARIGRFYRNVLLNFVSVDLCLRLLFEDRRSRILGRRIFDARSTLREKNLIRVEPAKDMPSRILTDFEVTLPEEMVGYLTGVGRLPEITSALTTTPGTLAKEQDIFADLVAPAAMLQRWRSAATSLGKATDAGDPIPVLLFQGPMGSGRAMLAGIFARSLGQPPRRVRLRGLRLKPEEWEAFLGEIMRGCLVEGQVPLFTDFETFEGEHSEDQERAFRGQVLLDAIESYPGPVMLTTESETTSLQLDRPLWTFPMPALGMQERELLWRRFLRAETPLEEGLSLSDVADLYPLTGGLIRRAAETALSRAASRGHDDEVRAEDLVAGIRSQLAHRLRSVAEFIEPHGSWKDVIVPKETEERLEEMAAYFRHRRTVWEDWDFRSKFSTLRGVSALFYGPPGTGKSFTAGVVAAELGMDLCRVDLSQVVSKWIGETEKNLGRVFDEAARGYVVLFFDEADSLFTKRTQVSSSVDRYANLEVNYLLQRMERYEGVTILATNHESALDPAFKRRLQFRIHFPLPEPPDRLRLWQSLIPEQAGVSDGVDWEYLADAFDMPGGHIRNAIVRAAFRAAQEQVGIDGDCLVWAAEREYEEMGRLIRR